jgi:hypothetical protein
MPQTKPVAIAGQEPSCGPHKKIHKWLPLNRKDWCLSFQIDKNIGNTICRTIIEFLNIIQRSDILFENVFETGLCIRPQVKVYTVGPVVKDKP